MTTLYGQIADDLAGDIYQGLYGAGHRLPSVRQLSKQRRVSISTVNQAYALLEDRGLIHAKPQSGYFVRPGAAEPLVPPPMSSGGEPRSVGKSDLLARMLTASNQQANINFGAALADPSFMPHRALQSHMQKVARFHSQELLNYQFAPGYQPLRNHIARRMREVGVRCHADEVLITQGCSEALALSLRCHTQPGDIVAVESPCYYGFLQLAKELNLRVIEIPTDPQRGFSLEALELALRQWQIKIVMVSSRYSNPTGAACDTEKQRALYDLARRCDAYIIEDDIYGEIGGEQAIDSVIKQFDSDGRVIYCSSFSKTVAPGLRVGWCIPGKSLKRLMDLQTFSSYGPASLSQFTLASYLQTGHYDKHLRQLRRLCGDNIERITQAVRQYFPEGTQISRPRGGYILWLCMPEDVSAIDLQHRALKQGINIAPGDLFSNSEDFGHYLRLNCALPWDDTLRDAIKTLGGLIETRAVTD